MTDRVLEILEDAYHLLDDKRRWCQGALAEDASGKTVPSREPTNAVQWCAVGAIRHVTPISETFTALKAAWERLDRASYDLYSYPAEAVNDLLGYRQVRAVYRRAIRKAASA